MQWSNRKTKQTDRDCQNGEKKNQQAFLTTFLKKYLQQGQPDCENGFMVFKWHRYEKLSIWEFEALLKNT